MTKSSPFNRTFDRWVILMETVFQLIENNPLLKFYFISSAFPVTHSHLSFFFFSPYLFSLSFRSLFIMLDSLSYWDPCTSAVGRAWLNQVLQRHDIARVLEPLLLLLLHPKTHRVSIQRVQAQRHWVQVFPEPPEQEPSEHIYTRDSGFSDSMQWPLILLLSFTVTYFHFLCPIVSPFLYFLCLFV